MTISIGDTVQRINEDYEGVKIGAIYLVVDVSDSELGIKLKGTPLGKWYKVENFIVVDPEELPDAVSAFKDAEIERTEKVIKKIVADRSMLEQDILLLDYKLEYHEESLKFLKGGDG